MGLETLSKDNKNFYPIDFSVEIDGSKAPGEILKSITEININEELDVGASFTFKLRDILDPDSGEFKMLENDLFKPGNEIVIKLGYVDSLETMITGQIKSLEPEFSAGQPPMLTVGGQDLSFDYLKKQSPGHDFVEKSYSDIVKEIANDAQLTPEVDDISITEPLIRKSSNESYYEFLMILATETGYTFRVEGKKMYFIKPDTDKEELLTLSLGKDILSFSPRYRTTGLYKKIEVRGNNPEDPSEPFVGIAEGSDEDAKAIKIINDVKVLSQDHATAIAKAEMAKAGDTKIEGDISCIGLAQLRAGGYIVIEKSGERFDGKYHITEARHTMSNSGYKTELKIKGCSS